MPSTESGCLARVAIWLVSSALSISTSKYLLDRRLNYPMHLLVLQLTGALIFKGLETFGQRLLRPANDESTITISAGKRTWTKYSVLYTACFSLAVVCAYQALHHSTNTPVVVMACSLVSLPRRSGAAAVNNNDNKIGWSLPALGRALLVATAIIVLFLFDYRLSTTGILMTASAAALLVLAQKFSVATHSGDCETEQEAMPCGSSIPLARAWGLVGSLVAAAIWSYFREPNFWRNMGASNPLAHSQGVLAFNLITSSLAWGIGNNIFSAWLDPGHCHVEKPYQCDMAPLVQSVSLVTCVLFGSLIWQTRIPYAISAWQWLAYGIVLTVPLSATYHDTEGYLPVTSEEKVGNSTEVVKDTTSQHQSLLSRAQGRAKTTTLLPFFMLMLVVLVYVTTSWMQSLTGYVPSPAGLDRIVEPTNALDIVIARYNEPASKVAMHIAKLLEQPKISQLQPTFRIYNKNEDTADSLFFLAQLDKQFDTFAERPHILVDALPNVGRESDSYLAHITTQWDNLSNHTLFVQADPHAELGMLQLIRDAFLPETGFLSLSHTHSANKGYCNSCDDCYDRDWTEKSSLLHELYSDFNRGQECKDMLLTYRGQFIISAARIRGTNKETYSKWLDELRNPDGRLHSTPYISSSLSRKKDSMSAPRAGFTLERMWSTMMQCNDRRIAERCPSWLSGMISPNGHAMPADCQCLD